MSRERQRIRFVSADDGVRLAWAESGSGPLLVKAANWMTNLDFDWDSPVWRHWMQFFSDNFRYVRYDERGCGLSDWQEKELTLDRWTADLELVVDAAQADGPFALLGMSQGAAVCVAYAVKHPERVSHMILYGGYALGAFHRGNPEARREYALITEAIRVGWGKDNPAFRQLFTSRFIPEGTHEQVAWFNELCRKTTTAEIADQLMRMRAKMNVLDVLDQVRVPTLVIHAREDAICPFEQGKILASRIPGAQFVELKSKNHVLLEHEPAWQDFQDAVLEFCGVRATEKHSDDPFSQLSPREREILSLLSEGLGNAQIGERLAISEKTVRNHISSVYDKLGVWSRSQAIVFARDRGFRA